MPDFLVGPGAGRRLELAVVAEHVAQIGGVVAAVVFDEARRLDQLEDVRVDLAGIEEMPGYVVQGPVLNGPGPAHLPYVPHVLHHQTAGRVGLTIVDLSRCGQSSPRPHRR